MSLIVLIAGLALLATAGARCGWNLAIANELWTQVGAKGSSRVLFFILSLFYAGAVALVFLLGALETSRRHEVLPLTLVLVYVLVCWWTYRNAYHAGSQRGIEIVIQRARDAL